MSALKEILNQLKVGKCDFDYYIPSIWLGKHSNDIEKIDPYKTYSQVIESILLQKQSGQEPHFDANWSRNAIVYNMFVRYTTAFDHDNNGVLGTTENDITSNANNIRETGTFLKAIILLPYIKALGCDAVYLLPITKIGKDGNKGDLGSPYAIRNPYIIEESLADNLINADVNMQFKAFVEAAHILGLKVILEFVFRTASKDSDWIKQHPEWFYWIDEDIKDEDFHSPEFEEKDLKEILKLPKGEGRHIVPLQEYKKLYSIPPQKDNVYFVNGKITGEVQGKKVKIPGAFADWPPDDIQPAWSDVTYLRMYDYQYDKTENYNYMAYNTLRYYDPEYARTENQNNSLWQTILGIIPYYEKDFEIDGVMIDMGHALPSALKSQIIGNARKIKPEFVFWDENFTPSTDSAKDGYNAVMGNLWALIHERDGVNKIIETIKKLPPIHMMGACENHNTPRCASEKLFAKLSKQCIILTYFLPFIIPFIHNGFELGETLPINTGLNFTSDELNKYRDEKLPLFYKRSLNWTSDYSLIPFLQKLHKIRKKYILSITETAPASFNHIETSHPQVVAFSRQKILDKPELIVILNTDMEKSVNVTLDLNINTPLHDKISNNAYKLNDGKLEVTLSPGDSLVLGT